MFFIPKVAMTSSNLPFQLRRVQFPVRLCFCMTINISQGQSLKVAGLDLTTPSFAHGQLYVDCSRMGSCSNLFILCGGVEHVMFFTHLPFSKLA